MGKIDDEKLTIHHKHYSIAKGIFKIATFYCLHFEMGWTERHSGRQRQIGAGGELCRSIERLFVF